MKENMKMARMTLKEYITSVMKTVNPCIKDGDTVQFTVNILIGKDDKIYICGKKGGRKIKFNAANFHELYR